MNKMIKNMIEALIEALQIFLRVETEESLEKKKHNPPAKKYRNLRALYAAAKEIGVKELTNGSNKRIEEYHAYASKENNEYLHQKIPWCASFVCWVLEEVGMGSTDSRLARSFMNWGVSTKKDPLPGDVVVFSRNGSSWQGHVGFFLKQDQGAGGMIWVLGGNQRDSVRISKYPKHSGSIKLLDIRRSSLHRKLSEVEQDLLWDISEGIIKDNGILTGGSVA